MKFREEKHLKEQINNIVKNNLKSEFDDIKDGWEGNISESNTSESNTSVKTLTGEKSNKTLFPKERGRDLSDEEKLRGIRIGIVLSGSKDLMGELEKRRKETRDKKQIENIRSASERLRQKEIEQLGSPIKYEDPVTEGIKLLSLRETVSNMLKERIYNSKQILNALREQNTSKDSENTSSVTKTEDNIDVPDKVSLYPFEKTARQRGIFYDEPIPSPDKGKLEKTEGRGRSSTDPKALPYHPKHNPSGYRPGEEPGKSVYRQFRMVQPWEKNLKPETP